MSDHKCASCDNPAPRGVVICSRCERQLRHNLGDMEAHRAELEITLTRQARFTAKIRNDAQPIPADPNIWDHRYSRPLRAHQGAGSSDNPPVPFDSRAGDILRDQRQVLVSWCKLVHDEISGTWPKSDTVAAMALFIEAHISEIRKHEAAGELVDEIRQLVSRVAAGVDYPEDRMRVHVGPCPEQVEGEQCPGELSLRIPYANDGKRPRVTCSACGTTWFPEQFHRLGYRIKFHEDGVERLRRAMFGAA